MCVSHYTRYSRIFKFNPTYLELRLISLVIQQLYTNA